MRTSSVTGIRVDALLTTVLLGRTAHTEQLGVPARVGWISDVSAVDNSQGELDSLFGNAVARVYQLSEILGLLTERGAQVDCRDARRAGERLVPDQARPVAHPERLHVIRSPDAQ